MKKRKDNSGYKKYLALIIGLLFILSISVIEGFERAFLGSLSHLQSDLTKDLLVHIYLLGFILVILGVYVFLKEKYGKKQKN